MWPADISILHVDVLLAAVEVTDDSLVDKVTKKSVKVGTGGRLEVVYDFEADTGECCVAVQL
jgi:hypothetical protein